LRGLRSAIAAAAGGLQLLLGPAGFSQQALPPLPPLSTPAPAGDSPVPAPSAEELNSCVPRFGHTGCAARLYAQLLCAVVGQSPVPPGLQQQLDSQYERAAIDFRGISVGQVESAAVRYYVPMLCPDKSREIQELFTPLAPPAG
jgi:hypothetical protein